MKKDLNTIFTFRINDSTNNNPIEMLLSRFSEASQQSAGFVFNLTNTGAIIDTILDEKLIKTVSTLKVYFYFPTSGFKVFILKKERSKTIDKFEAEALKKTISKF